MMSRQVLVAMTTLLVMKSVVISQTVIATNSISSIKSSSEMPTNSIVTMSTGSRSTITTMTTVSVTSTGSPESSTTSSPVGSLPIDIIIGSAVAAGVALVVIATVIILCIVIVGKKKRKKKFSLSEENERGETKDGGYINALYDVDAVTGDLCGDEVGKNREQEVDVNADQQKKKRSSKSSQSSKSSKLSKNSGTSKTSKTSKVSNSSRNSKSSSVISTGNYDYASDGNMSPGSRSQCSLPSGVNNTDKERCSREVRSQLLDGSYEYAYATTSMDRVSSSTSTSSTKSPKKRAFTGSSRTHSLRKENEMIIYMAPAMDENSLYAQFAEIRVRCLTRDKIKITDMIGSGQFGKVHQGEWAAPGEEEKVGVALKTLKEGAGKEDKVKFLQEAAIMGQFSHPNVVKLHGVVTEGEPMMIVLELLPKGDLRNYLFSLRNKSEEGDEHTLLSFCRQIAAGMCYLASKAFIHRDLAVRNILVSEDGICKIADFGMSRDLMDENYYISHGGKIPVKWTAPEALHFKKFSTASDVWSFGCVMFEIWSLGHKPFETWSNNQAILEVDEGFRLAPPPGCPRAVYEVAIQCWHPETSKRPTFTDIMQRFSLPDTKLLKWREEDKCADPEAAILGADLDAGLSLYKDLQERYLQKDADKETSKNNNLVVAEPSYDDPVSVTFAEDKAEPLRSKLELPSGLNPCNDKGNRFLPPLKENRMIVESATAGAHSYEDPILLSILEEKNDTVYDL